MKALSIKRWMSGNGIILIAVFLLGSSCDLMDFLRPAAVKEKARTQEAQKNGAAEPESMMSPAEKMAFHRWLAKEMIEQVLGRPVKDKSETENWANVLSQRGSVEGVYHGIVLSAEYTGLEAGKADVKALRFFANEMAMLDFPIATENDPKVKAASEKYAQENMGSSVYVMKRELGEKVLKESVKRKDNRETLAAWYSAIAARWARQGVDFGMAQRNKPEEVFHFNWAKENNLGMVQWELLNKAHRLMNAYSGIAVNPAGKK